MGDRGRSDIGRILREMRRMVLASDDKRATALAELKSVESGDPFKILIGTILSHRTRDENTSKATDRLFARFKTPKELAEADPKVVRALIRSVGFYNVKTRSIIKVARQVVEEHDGKVPPTMGGLLELHSVGRKTANCVLVYGFDTPAIPVDTHVHRIANRLGIVETKKPGETELELTKKVPRSYWLELNEVFVRFGQTICKPVGPKCDVCSLRGSCRYYREVVSKRKPKAAG